MDRQAVELVICCMYLEYRFDSVFDYLFRCFPVELSA